MDGQQAAATLGVGPRATRDEIRRAFRARAKVAHPDTGSTGSMERFIVLRRAFDLLMVDAPTTASTPAGEPGPNRRRPNPFDRVEPTSARPPTTIDLTDVVRRTTRPSSARTAAGSAAHVGLDPAAPKRDGRGLTFADHLSAALARP